MDTNGKRITLNDLSDVLQIVLHLGIKILYI